MAAFLGQKSLLTTSTTKGSVNGAQAGRDRPIFGLLPELTKKQ